MSEQKSELQSSLDDVSSAITQFSAVEAGIATLRDKYEKVIFAVDTPEGLKDAKEARLAIREPRYNVERIRKDAKAPILELGRRLDARAKQITDALLAIEEPIDMAIKQEEGRKERERQAKIDAEVKRVESIKDRIKELRGAVAAVTCMGAPSSVKVGQFIDDMEKIVVDDSFAEFQQEAADARLATLATLRQLHAAAVEREAEAERVKAERAELARLREEAAARDKKEREAREAEEAKARAAREEEDRKQREALAEQRRQQEAEQARIDEERAALEREQAEQRRKAEEAERQRLAAAEAERKRKEAAERAARRAKFPGEQAIVDALCAHFEVQPEVVMKWIAELRKKAA